jgi:hypothetical protein
MFVGTMRTTYAIPAVMKAQSGAAMNQIVSCQPHRHGAFPAKLALTL